MTEFIAENPDADKDDNKAILPIDESPRYLSLDAAFLSDAQIVLDALRTDSEPLSHSDLTRLHLNSQAVMEGFSFPEELPVILTSAQSYFPVGRKYPVNPFALILAIREAEKVGAGLEFVVMHPKAKDTKLRTQCEWACGTVEKNFQRFSTQTQEGDFITFLGKRYAPIGAENDLLELNQHWVGNVKSFYRKYSEK
ncbi:MAG: hypothetical protein WCP87_04945 [Atribacterota bacterium]